MSDKETVDCVESESDSSNEEWWDDSCFADDSREYTVTFLNEPDVYVYIRYSAVPYV